MPVVSVRNYVKKIVSDTDFQGRQAWSIGKTNFILPIWICIRLSEIYRYYEIWQAYEIVYLKNRLSDIFQEDTAVHWIINLRIKHFKPNNLICICVHPLAVASRLQLRRLAHQIICSINMMCRYIFNKHVPVRFYFR